VRNGGGKPERFPLTEIGIDWLESRSIDVELAVNLGLESCALYGREGISIPFVIDGEVVNHVYRSIRKKAFHLDIGGRLCLWNQDVIFDRTLSSHPLIITEGAFDAISAIQAGFPRAISVPNGTGTSMSILDPYLLYLRQLPVVILAIDDDQDGHRLLHDLVVRIGRPRCKWLQYPRDCKDLNDVLHRHGPARVAEALAGARWVKVDGVARMRDLPPVPVAHAYDPGFAALGDHYRLRLGDFTVVTGVPNSGKSTWVVDLACRMVSNHGWRVAFASFEMRAKPDLERRLRQWYGGKPPEHLSLRELEAADNWINNNLTMIVRAEDDDYDRVPGFPHENDDDEDGLTLGWLHEKIMTAVLRHEVNMVVIDPWNGLDLIAAPGMSESRYISHCLKELQGLAQKYAIHLMVVAHPTKMRKEKDGKQPAPTLYDIADSAAFYNRPDVGIIIHRDEDGDTEIRVAKSRYFDQIGRPGKLTMHFDSHAGRFHTREDLL